MTVIDQFLWVIYPYLMLTTFVVGHIYRYNTDQFGWSAKSSEFLEKPLLKWGSTLFHWGIIFAFFGHVAGILVPKWIYPALGITDYMYHLGAIYGGGLFGLITIVGIIILTYRRMSILRIRVHSTLMDWVVGISLLITISLGVYVTIIRNTLVETFDYRSTIAPWFRGLLTFSPDPTLMINVPLSYQLHVFFAFLIFGLFPFTRLVHMWSLPLEYLKRSYIIFRSNNFFRMHRENKPK